AQHNQALLLEGHRKNKKRKRKEKENRKNKKRKHKSSSRREKKERDRRDGERKSGSRSRTKKSRIRVPDEESGSSATSESERENGRVEPESVVRDLTREFPGVAGDLKQKLKENGDGVFLLRSNARPTLEIVGPLISPQVVEPKSVTDDVNVEKVQEGDNLVAGNDEASGPRRRVIGPAMPSAELLAAAAKLTEAQAELRDAELEEDDRFFIGPPPPAVVAEADSSNEAERFEEITRIMVNDDGNPCDILGVNHKMSLDNVKKRSTKKRKLSEVGQKRKQSSSGSSRQQRRSGSGNTRGNLGTGKRTSQLVAVMVYGILALGKELRKSSS
ncbi:hypothetical protein AKJ16_DCAP03264, partial [Drosera capensis]